jgi:hypothetical protein
MKVKKRWIFLTEFHLEINFAQFTHFIKQVTATKYLTSNI